MSILRVANLQFNAAGTRRIDYDPVADDGIIKVSAAAVKLPVGDNASRPASQAGMIRYNSDTGYVEFGGAAGWVAVASNVAFDVANAAFASQNADYSSSNAAYNTANNAYASINSNWTVTNTVYGVANAAFASANNVGPQLAPAYNTANAAFGVANTALQNTNVTLAGNLTVTGNVVANKQVTVTYTPTTSVNAAITTAAANTQGGTGYADFLKVTNLSGGTNPNKTFRLNSTGGFEIINSAYSATIFTLDNNGILATAPRGITSSSMPAGSILQVQSTTLTSTFTTSSTSWADLTGMSVSITPTSATSKILVQISLNFQGDSSTQGYCRIDRNGTVIGVGDANGSRYRFTINQYVNQQNEARTISMTYLDSPATTSALTYKLQLTNQGLGTVYVNRSTAWADNATSGTGISTITVYEIAQ